MYGILSLQLLLTMAIMMPFIFHDGAKTFVRNNRWMYWFAFGLVMVSMKSRLSDVVSATCHGKLTFPDYCLFNKGGQDKGGTREVKQAK